MNRSQNYDCQLPPEALNELLRPRRPRILVLNSKKPLAHTRAGRALIGAGVGLGCWLILIGLITAGWSILHPNPVMPPSHSRPIPVIQPTPVARPSPARAELVAPRATLVKQMSEAEYQRRWAAHELTLADINRHDRGE